MIIPRLFFDTRDFLLYCIPITPIGPRMDASRPSSLNISPIYDIAEEKTSAALRDAFTVLDDTLFNLSQSSSKSAHMDALRMLRTHRDHLLSQWKTRLNQAFISGVSPAPSSSSTSGLSLVPNDELERQLAVLQMGALWSKHHANETNIMERLLESGDIPPHTFPLHPQLLSRLVGNWIEEVQLPTESELVALKILERELDKSLKALYIKTIEQLRNQGLKDAAPSIQRPTSPEPPEPVNTSWLEQVEEHASPTFEAPRYGQPASSAQWDPHTQQLLAQALNQLLASEGVPSDPGHAPRSADPRTVDNDWNIDPVNWDPTAEDLLQVLRTRRTTRPPVAPVATMSQSAVRSVLDVLQRDLPQSVRNVARDDYQLLTKQFKAEMLDKALQIGVRDEHSALTDRDEDAIDIVGMLFEIFLSEREIIADMRENIAQLLAAYVKVALNDRKMFMHKAHPARRFLDVLAQACEGNNGVSLSERNTLNKVSDSIEKLVTNFNEDVAIFELAESEVKNFIAQQKVAVEHSEKRAAEAQKGTERLDVAKRQSQEIFEKHAAHWPWAQDKFEDLKKYWTQHHTMTVLRNENDAEKIEHSEQILRNILARIDHPSQPLEGVADDLQTVLLSSGITDSAASSVVSQIVSQMVNVSPTMPQDFATPNSEMPPSPSIESHVTLSSNVFDHSPPETDMGFSPETHRQLVDYFKNMPLGTWIDFVRNDGQIVSTKLSWVSPISMRLLFVTARGTKHAVEYAEDLAKFVVLDRVRLREFGLGESGFEHSFKKAVEQLNVPSADLAADAPTDAVRKTLH